MNISELQYESIITYLEEFLELPPLEGPVFYENGIYSKSQYNKIVAKQRN